MSTTKLDNNNNTTIKPDDALELVVETVKDLDAPVGVKFGVWGGSLKSASYTQTQSDLRLKTRVARLDGSLARLRALHNQRTRKGDTT